MKIKIGVHVTISKRDIYGNCYYLTEIINHETGESFKYNDNTDNAIYFAREIGFDWSEIRKTEEIIPIRQWDRISKSFPYISYEKIIEKLKSWL